MPICTRTISKSALATDTKTAPAREAHSFVGQSCAQYLRERRFHELSAGSVYTDNCGYHVIPAA